MSTQTIYYPTDPSLDASIAPQSLFMNNGFSPEFLSLSLLDKANHPEVQMSPNMSFFPHQPSTTQAVASAGDEDNRPRLRNRALRPAPPDARKQSIESEMNQPPFLHQYGSMSSFSSGSFNPAEQEFVYEGGHRSSHSDASSNKSTSPLQWPSDDKAKRAKHLERNRAAASKSRQKKKRETDLLRNRFQEVSRRRSDLEDEIKDLHSKLLFLKDQILMHSRCDDDAINLYLGRMVKQATKHESISSVSSGDADDESARNRHGSDSVTPPDDELPEIQGPDQTQSTTDPRILDLSSPEQMHMRLDEPNGLPCTTEKSGMEQMLSDENRNIFDYQISIG
ncbi:hypothetical protein BJY04DRAFT_211338 [Aspergillus karnatakaensis]|uniref:bZIP transcription factor n=1 Tax=Aspergillus karnatakaensis TaxID=1810916 RepID=UPI003CCCB6C7